MGAAVERNIARVLISKRDEEGKWKHFKPHPDDELVDRVEMAIVPRFKMSHLSGDEWRTSGVVRLFHKGMLLYERSYISLQDAAKHLPWLVTVVDEELMFSSEKELQDRHDALVDDRVKGLKCMQAGCANEAVFVFEIKELFAKGGQKLDPSESERHITLRCFCEEHAERGDSDLEDNDENYTLVEDRRPAQKRDGTHWVW